jgi:hypothetical protein
MTKRRALMGRNASYGIYKNKEYRIIDEKFFKIMISSYDPNDLQDGFKLDADPSNETFVKWVARKKITTAYSINTFCRYQGYQFGSIKSDRDKYLILGGNERLCKELQFSMVDRGVYEKWVEQSELERIWEIRRPSHNFQSVSEVERNGQYAVYKGKEYQFGGVRNGIYGLFLLSEDKTDLEKGFNMDMGYKSFVTKKVEWKDIAPHYIITLCQYKGYEFQAIRRNGSQVLIHTNYQHIFEALQPQLFVPEEGVYEAWVEEKELEKLWEEQMPYEE